MKLAVIPARGGSKRIPRKNIKEFCGRPMIAWAIEAAQKSACFDRIIVSTDDDEIAVVSRQWGAEVPFVRPNNLADDLTPTVPVIANAIGMCEKSGREIDFACCIYPCAPLIQIDDLVAAFRILEHSNYSYIFPVTEYSSPIQRALRRNNDGRVYPLFQENELECTQNLETAYHDAGQFYWGKKDAWMNIQRVHSHGYGIVIPKWRVVDIDNVEDWIRAELIFKILNGKADG